jgi:hypothetical protein
MLAARVIMRRGGAHIEILLIAGGYDLAPPV